MDNTDNVAGSRFLASTLHEIRTPIQTIIGTVELLSDTKLDKEQSEYVHQIKFSANVLLSLANEILDFTRFKSNEFKLENIPFDIGSLAEQVVDLISIDALNKGIELITNIDESIPLFVMGDPVRIQQIFLNLLKNAVKFTHSGYIELNVCRKDKNLEIHLLDSGIGVADDKKKLIFTDYYQVDASTSRKYGGTGLGLAICKNLVNAMHGEIGVNDNLEGRGSDFYFKIPLEECVNPPVEQSFELDGKDSDFSAENFSKERILIVDDSIRSCISLKNKLVNFGYKHVEFSNSGEDALKLMHAAAKSKEAYTIIFIDMIMSGMDGWRLASNITNNKDINLAKLFLLIPEGQANKDAKMQMLNWFNGYLRKPVKRKNLIDALKEASSESIELEEVEDKKILEEKAKEDKKKADLEVASGCKILIAEDHPVNRKLLEAFLKKFGADVYLAENGKEAIEQVTVHKDIELIFMDIQMPEKNGTDATVELRMKGFKGIIIACTANNDQDDFQKYKSLGMNDILVKPFKRESVKKMLDNWISLLKMPDAQQIACLTNMSNMACDAWDVKDFMDTTGNDFNFALEVITDYEKQTEEILAQLKAETEKNRECDFDFIRRAGHTLNGSSSAISAFCLAKLGEKINAAAKQKNIVLIESARVEFALEFTNLKNIITSWKSNL